MSEPTGKVRSKKNSYIQQTHARDQCLNNPDSLPGKPGAVDHLRTTPNLGTKVLADKPTIDEFLVGCSNPKVERLGTEVYRRKMNGAIVSRPQLLGQTKSSECVGVRDAELA
jgi:hypothetical protein